MISGQFRRPQTPGQRKSPLRRGDAAGYNNAMAKKRLPPVSAAPVRRYQSPNIPLAAIRRYARQIAERFGPEKIILFGSYAYGEPNEDSDVDLFVIMPAYDVVSKAVQIRLAFESPFPLDLIVRTPKQLERGLRENDWFLREIIEKGKVLYDAQNSSVGPEGRGRSRRGSRRGRPNTAPAGPGVLPLPAGGGEVSQGPSARVRRRRSKNPRPGNSSSAALAP
jgi:predicted nucleotidyltransferase